MAVVRRDAFVPTLFAFPGQQPLRLRSPWAALAEMAQPPLLWAALTGAAPSLPPVLTDFDAVALVGRRPGRVPSNPCVEPIFTAPSFQLLAVRHGERCTAGRR